MQIIDNYLDTVFTGYPQTPRTEEVKRELRAMMDDVYSGAIAAGRTQSEAVGQAIAEFGSMDEITALLGVPEGKPRTHCRPLRFPRPATLPMSTIGRGGSWLGRWPYLFSPPFRSCHST